MDKRLVIKDDFWNYISSFSFYDSVFAFLNRFSEFNKYDDEYLVSLIRKFVSKFGCDNTYHKFILRSYNLLRSNKVISKDRDKERVSRFLRYLYYYIHINELRRLSYVS